MSNLFSQFVDSSFDPIVIAFAVLLFDLLIGDPNWLYRRIPHPIVPIGNFIGWLEKCFNKSSRSKEVQFLSGAFIALTTIILAGLVGYMITLLCRQIPAGGLIIAILASSLIACKGLYQAVAKVRDGLDISLDAGRDAVRHIVGRDPDSLDTAGVARAGIESLAENFLDGTISPLFWFVLLGLPGLLIYKAINTLDSMIGHRNARYEYFGKFAARLDDAANYIPARLTGLLIAACSVFLPKADVAAAFKVLFQDAGKHKSMNAGWQEAAMAGALDISLAGPRQYGGKLTPDHWMNEAGRKDCSANDMSRALKLYAICTAVLVIILLVLGYLWVR